MTTNLGELIAHWNIHRNIWTDSTVRALLELRELQEKYERLRRAAESYVLTEPHDYGEFAYGEEYYRRLEALRAALAEDQVPDKGVQ